MEARAPKRVLVADDEPLLRRLMERILRAHGFEVVTAADGARAVAQVEASDGVLGAVVVDVGMPPRGGAAALQEILARRPGLGVVVTSGVAPDAELRALLAERRGVFLAKPFAPEALVRAVEDAVGSAPGRRATDAPGTEEG